MNQDGIDERRGSELRFGVRAKILRQIGFDSYAEYLASPLWKRIANAARARANFRCARCRQRGWQVHHRRYDLATMTGKVPGDLIVLCDECHVKEEKIENARVGLAARVAVPTSDLGHLYRPRVLANGRVRKARYASAAEREQRLAERRERKAKRNGVRP
jgi:hypothetical protein